MNKAVEIVDATEKLLRDAVGPGCAEELQDARTRIVEKLGGEVDDNP